MSHRAFSLPTGTAGNATFTGGSFGLFLTVGSSPIVVSTLDAFLDTTTTDLKSSKSVKLYNADTQVVLAATTIDPGELAAGTVSKVGAYLSKAITPVTIPGGTNLMLSVSGFDTDKFDNVKQNGGVALTTDSGGGLIIYGSAAGFYSTSAGYPSTADSGPANNYGGASFTYDAVPVVSGVTVSPTTATGSQQFSAVVTGTGSPGQAVTWTASSGAISPAGLFTAPAATSSVQSITITATSTANTGKSGTATVTIAATASPTSPPTTPTAPTPTPTTPTAPATPAVGFIGDSITAGAGATPGVNDAATVSGQRLTVLNGGTIVPIVNRGVSGTSTVDWLPGGQYLAPAITALKTAGVTAVQLALGTNDTKVAIRTSVSGYSANLQAIAAVLVSNGFRVVIPYPPCLNLTAAAASYPGVWDAASVALLQAYQPAIDALANGTTIARGATEEFAFFQAHPTLLVDGIHPNPAGHAAKGELDTAPLARVLSFIAAAPTPTATTPTPTATTPNTSMSVPTAQQVVDELFNRSQFLDLLASRVGVYDVKLCPGYTVIKDQWGQPRYRFPVAGRDSVEVYRGGVWIIPSALKP